VKPLRCAEKLLQISQLGLQFRRPTLSPTNDIIHTLSMSGLDTIVNKIALRYRDGVTIRAIKDAILALPEEQRLELEDWLSEQWDAQMSKDFSRGGRGTALIEHVDAEIETGKFRPLEPQKTIS
jgi:hypothetical protein